MAIINFDFPDVPEKLTGRIVNNNVNELEQASKEMLEVLNREYPLKEGDQWLIWCSFKGNILPDFTKVSLHAVSKHAEEYIGPPGMNITQDSM